MPSTPNTPAVLTTSARPVTNLNDRDLLLAVAEGEILTAFEDSTIIADKVQIKTLAPNTDRHQFLATGKLNAFYMDRGDELSGQDFRVDERYVKLDRPMVSPLEFYDFDSILTRPDLRATAMREQGYALSRKFDLDTLATVARASLIYSLRGSAFGTYQTYGTTLADNIDNTDGKLIVPYWNKWSAATIDEQLQPGIGHPGGSALAIDYADANAQNATTAATLYQAILRVDELMDEKNVPMEGRWGVMPLSVFRNLVHARDLSAAPFYFANQNTEAGLPNYLNGQTNGQIMTMKIGNITVYGSNRFPRGDVGISGTGVNTAAKWPEAKYAVNWSTCRGVFWQQSAAANIVKLGATMEAQRDTRRQSDFTVVKMMSGHDAVRPESAVTLWDDAAGTVSGTDGFIADSGDILWSVANEAQRVFVEKTSYDPNG